jgi:peroxin-4
MLQNPNPDSPLNCDAANLLRANDKDGYIALAQYYTLKYAISK